MVDPVGRLPDEMMHTSFQTVRNASASFRRFEKISVLYLFSYVTAHLYVKMEQLRKYCKTLTQYLKMPVENVAPHKVDVRLIYTFFSLLVNGYA